MLAQHWSEILFATHNKILNSGSTAAGVADLLSSDSVQRSVNESHLPAVLYCSIGGLI